MKREDAEVLLRRAEEQWERVKDETEEDARMEQENPRYRSKGLTRRYNAIRADRTARAMVEQAT